MMLHGASYDNDTETLKVVIPSRDMDRVLWRLRGRRGLSAMRRLGALVRRAVRLAALPEGYRGGRPVAPLHLPAIGKPRK